MMKRCVAVSVCVLSVLAGAALAQPVSLDDFSVDQALPVLASAGQTEASSVAGAMLGGHRALRAEATVMGGGNTVDLYATGGALTFVRTGGATCSIRAWWDGTTGSTAPNTTTGLGGIDLRANGNNEFTLVVSSAMNAPSMTLTVYSSASAASSMAFTLPNAGGTLRLFYQNFAQASGASSPASFSSVRAIVLSTTSNSGLAGGTIESITMESTPVVSLSIDDFATDQILPVLTAAPQTEASSVAGAMLGGHRALRAEATVMGGGSSVDLYASGGALTFVRSGGTTCTIRAWWDGTTGSTSPSTASGLGGMNLLGGNYQFTVVVTNAMSAPSMTLKVSSSATSASTAAFSLPNAGGTVVVPYSSFVQAAGATSPADFGSVTAIELYATNTSGLAGGTIESITATPVELTSFSAE